MVFPSGYWVVIAKVDTERSFDFLVMVVDWMIGGLGWIGAEPRYRILIGREGTEQAVGVREARWEAQARKDLSEVAATMVEASDAEVRDLYGLDF